MKVDYTHDREIVNYGNKAKSYIGQVLPIEVRRWLDITPGGHCIILWNSTWPVTFDVYFEREDDMMLFKLTWG